MSRTSFAEIDCGVAQALEQVGDKWALVILRSAFLGLRRFDEFSTHLNIAPNILSNRLSKLVERDIMYKKKAPDDGRVIEYKLTPKGFELYPLVVFLNQWAERWLSSPDGARVVFTELRTDKEIRPIQVLSEEGDVLTARDVKISGGTAGSQVMEDAHRIVAARRKKAKT